MFKPPFSKSSNESKTMPDLPNLLESQTDIPTEEKLIIRNPSSHAPRILLLYGSLREKSFSRLVIEESAKILEHLGAEIKIFNPNDLPIKNPRYEDHPKVHELLELVKWSEGQVWCSPEMHGSISSVIKNQLDWIPLSIGSIRPTQGKTLAVMQIEGGSQSFNSVNQLRIIGRWLRMLTIPNQFSVGKVYNEFDENENMHDSNYYDRIVDVMEELLKFTYLTRDRKEYLVNRYSERKEKSLNI